MINSARESIADERMASRRKPASLPTRKPRTSAPRGRAGLRGQLAATIQILVSQRLLGAVEALAEAEPVGELFLKGFSKPVPAFNVVGLTVPKDGGVVER